MIMILQRVLPCVLLALLAACSDGSDPRSATNIDSSDPQVFIASNGDVVLQLEGRTLFAMPGNKAPLAREFTESAFGIGVIGFTRKDETVDPLNLTESQQVGAGVKLDFRNADGSRQASLEARPVSAQETLFRFTLTGTSADSIAVPVRCDSGGSFHGFGEQYNATDQRGEAFGLFVNEQGNGRTGSGGISGDEHTTYFPMPYYLDVRGFGVLFDTARRVQLDLCAADPAVAWIEVIGGDSIEWTVFHGPTGKDVIRQLADEVGRPAKPPEWAYGLWIGAQGGRDKVLAEVAALEAADIPVTALWVQDWGGHRRNFDGGDGVQYRWAPDEECNERDDQQAPIPKDVCYPDIAGMVAGLRARGYRFLTYANPFVVKDLDARFTPNHFAEMDAAGLLMKSPAGGTYEFFGANIPQRDGHADLTLPAAREYIKDALRKMVTDYGFDGWMADFSEWTPLDAVVSDGTDAIEVRNTYPTQWQRLTREVMEELRADGDWVMFARAGWAGTQGAAQIHWVGDQETNWSTLDGLPTVIPAMLNLGLAGQPYVTHDIAGFAKGTGPSDEELYMRWTELGAFTPIMRTHEGADKEGNWSWEKSPATTAHFRRFTLVHCALRPLFMTLSDEAQKTSTPILRHMMLEFPDDPQTYSLSDQYMLGATYLVAPVLEQGATTRSVYFPAGTWYNVWNGAAIVGGARVTVDAPMGSPPVYSLGVDRPELRQAEFLATASCR
jgi:sulfoquinovosidase